MELISIMVTNDQIQFYLREPYKEMVNMALLESYLKHGELMQWAVEKILRIKL